MKKILDLLHKYIFIAVTSIQTVLAIIWFGSTKLTFLKSFIGFVSVAAVVVLTLSVTKKKIGKKWFYTAAVYIITLPIVLDAALLSGNIAGLPKAPAAGFTKLCVQRFAWPYFYEMGGFEGNDYFEAGTALVLSVSPKYLYTDLYPVIDANYPEDEARQIYKGFVTRALGMHKKDNALQAFREFTTYAFTPYSVIKDYISGLECVSNNGDNYDEFTSGNRRLSRIYFYFSAFAFAFMTVTGLADLIVNKELSLKRTLILTALVAVVSLYDIFFTVRGFDHRNSVLILLIWACIIIAPLRRRDEDC